MHKKLVSFKYISLILLLIWGLFIFVSNANALLTFNKIENEEKKTDNPTYNTYENLINVNNIGKVWTDKSVFNDDVTFDNNIIKKDEDEDFLVSLSALSLGIDLNVKEGNVKDIVILQDLSGSMINNNVSSSSGSITRLQASKNAINELLELITKANNSLSLEDEKFRVGLVGFAGNGAQHVVFNLTEVNSNNLADLKSKVNGMTPSGGTYISSGINLSYNQIQTNGRKNVDSAIITFLDGLPSPESDGQVAINAANNIKKNGVIMYSVIVNNDAKGGTSTNIDKIGQALSSNYDNAISTSNLGSKTGNTYYYIPKTADELINSFKNIIKTIQRKNYTLEKNTKLTFTDKLGDYMEVKKIKALYYNGNLYTKIDEPLVGEENKKDGIITYKFTNDIVDSFGKKANTNTIDIKVIKSNNVEIGDIITISIPYNLVPVATYDVKSTFLTNSTVYTTTLKSAIPISIIYSVNVKDAIFNLFRTNDNGIKEYINKNGYIKDYEGYANFYSNYYEDGENGTTEVIYVPYSKNDYYYYEDSTYLYIKNDSGYSLYSGTELVKEQKYYTKKTAYKVGEKINSEEVFEEVINPKNALKDAANNWYFSSGTKKKLVPYVKENNETKTATNLNFSNWDKTEIKTLLGNNGVVLINMSVDRINIKIAKIWEDSNNESGQRPKSIKIRLKRNGEYLEEKYNIVLSEENNWSYTYENLPLSIDGEKVNYTIEEEKLDNYLSKIEGNQEEGFTITNTIIIENPNTGFKMAIIVIVLSIMLILICYYFRDKRNRLYKI